MNMPKTVLEVCLFLFAVGIWVYDIWMLASKLR